MKKLFASTLLTLILTLSCASLTATASDFKPSIIPRPSNLPGPTIDNQDEQRSIIGEKLLPRFAIGLIGLAGGAALLFLVISGLRYATLYGEEEGVEKAKNQALYAVIGLVISLLAYTIVTVITNIDYGSDKTNDGIVSRTNPIQNRYDQKPNKTPPPDLSDPRGQRISQLPEIQFIK